MIPQVNVVMIALAAIDHMVPHKYGIAIINDVASLLVTDWPGDLVVASALREARASNGCRILAPAGLA